MLMLLNPRYQQGMGKLGLAANPKLRHPAQAVPSHQPTPELVTSWVPAFAGMTGLVG